MEPCILVRISQSNRRWGGGGARLCNMQSNESESVKQLRTPRRNISDASGRSDSLFVPCGGQVTRRAHALHTSARGEGPIARMLDSKTLAGPKLPTHLFCQKLDGKRLHRWFLTPLNCAWVKSSKSLSCNGVSFTTIMAVQFNSN